MRMPMEDWLRGCVYHDGRHGEVTLSTDKVLEIANYIQLTRTSLTDGMIELPPYDRKDEPQTYVINPQEPTNDDKCFECDDFFTCGGQCNKIEDEPQTDCESCKHYNPNHEAIACERCLDGKYSRYEPQTERSE